MSADPHLPADEQQRQQQGDLGAVADVGSLGVDLAGAAARNLPVNEPAATSALTGLGETAAAAAEVADAVSGVADAAGAAGDILSALGELFGGL